MRGICTKTIGAISQLGIKKITFPPKPDGHTDRQTHGRTFAFYRVTLLLKRMEIHILIGKVMQSKELIV